MQNWKRIPSRELVYHQWKKNSLDLHWMCYTGNVNSHNSWTRLFVKHEITVLKSDYSRYITHWIIRIGLQVLCFSKLKTCVENKKTPKTKPKINPKRKPNWGSGWILNLQRNSSMASSQENCTTCHHYTLHSLIE